MEVTVQTFPYHLPRILDDLATCCFVSMDFEFSGIATTSSNPNRGSQTLQARYEEVKKSADKYQILQVGLTICHEDTENASYTLKPYNVNLNPIIDRRLEVERGWTMQSSAIEFLLENKFSIDSILKQGVQYLSREEEKQVIANAIERRDRVATHTSIDVKETEHESLAFLKAVRRLVDDWLALGATREEYLNIPPPTRLGVSQSSKSLPSALNRFQKRLVHQLIEVEYPSLVTISRPDFIQIIDYNEERERSVREQRVTRVRERTWKQTGFRWVAEALAGGDLTNLDSGYFIGIMASSAAVEPKYPLNEFSDKLKQRLKEHRPVLVGHNLFSDLIYFCRCFFGPLPSKVEEFQSMAHELFPVLMDTKYMATHNCGSINPRSSLSELNENLAKKAIPKISIHPQHSKYTTQKIEHEAGYDSLLTAQVFIRLSAQLRDGGVDLPQQKSTKGAQDTSNLQQAYQEVAPDAYAEGRLQTTSGSAQKTFEQKSRPSSTGSPRAPTTRVLGTRFDLLEIEEAIDEVDSNIPIDDRRLSLGPTDSVEVMQKAASGELIPRLGAEFWKVYGNKLRVFGTLERVCVMGPSIVDSRVCRSCQETLVRRNYASTAAPSSASETISTPASTFPVVRPTHIIKAGVALSRPPQITRDLTPFEKAYFFYQKRLNERLALPFTKYFYFKRGTPADEDWKRKIRERQTPARDIGKYNAYSKEAWNDELLVGAVESEPEHQIEMLVQDAEATVNATSQDTSKKEEIPRPFPRVTEADQKNDQRSLNRALQRTLYLLVQTKDGFWKLPSSPVETGESLRVAAERTLEQSAGVNMNTWMVGYHPVGHHIYNFRHPKTDPATGQQWFGEKTFFMKGRIMAGQADLSTNVQDLQDFKWLAKEEIAKFVLPQYYSNIKNMLAER
ncbi:hypothetical protein CNMCM8980_007556 [Aspergillus fumigatiaffinis]|nr:hypothetical protein CNMCM5878_002785 [Aspergillus fumigatiaffinis]KAF4224493.1 hypothetical protein CNMCM6457_009353 [Aspergillus fumigatiaffinis]KAF4247256.1 hypothetical protein CNMCM8980_007556 [Aspergillus fumigatiaffinis]